MAIVTSTEVKSYLNIATGDSSKDKQIDYLIPVVEADYLTIMNIPWPIDRYGTYGDTGDSYYPIGSEAVASQMIGFKLAAFDDNGRIVSSERNLSYNVSYVSGKTISGYPKSIVGSIHKYINGR